MKATQQNQGREDNITYLMLVIILIWASQNSTAYSIPTSNATLTNVSASNFTCNSTILNPTAENMSALIFISTSVKGTLYTTYTPCSKNTTFNLTKSVNISFSTCETIYCASEASLCLYENGSVSIAQRTPIQGTSCSTTTTSTSLAPMLVDDDVTYTSLWGLKEGGDLNGSMGTGIGNTTGLGSIILGISKTNFLKLVSLFLITLIILSVSAISVKAGLVTGITTADIFILVLKWMDIPISLFLLINFLAVLIFFTGGKK